MIYIIAIFLTCIVFTLIFLINTFKWMFKVKGGSREERFVLPEQENLIVPIIKYIEYDVVHLKDQIFYTNKISLHPKYGAIYVPNDKFKENLINQQVRRMAEKMLINGLIKIKDIGYPDNIFYHNAGNPYANVLLLEAKICKPRNN